MLIRERHEVWSAYEAGLADAEDDDLTVYAARRDAVLESLDAQFMQRRSTRFRRIAAVAAAVALTTGAGTAPAVGGTEKPSRRAAGRSNRQPGPGHQDR
jgi:hypothetical protein